MLVLNGEVEWRMEMEWNGEVGDRIRDESWIIDIHGYTFLRRR